MVAPPALSEPARLHALARSELLDSGTEAVFDRLTRLASRLLATPIAAMSLLDATLLYQKSAVGLGMEPVPVQDALCQHVVTSRAPCAVADLRETPDLVGAAAAQSFGVLAYCGVPLLDSEGHALGLFCAMDSSPRAWSAEDIELLSELATSAMTELELRHSNRHLRERERETQALRERQIQLASAAEAATEAISLIDLAGRVTAWNPACERLYGYAAEEVIGRHLGEIGVLPDTDDGDGFSLHARALAGESVMARRVPRRRRDGSQVYVSANLAPVRDAAGEIVGATAVARDITERLALRVELEASERRFRHTFDDAPAGIIIVAPDRTVLDANRGFCEIVGFGTAELIGRTLEGITHPADLDVDLVHARRVLAGECSSVSFEKRYRHRGGRVVHVRLTASLVRAADGTPEYFVVHVEDITASREAQSALVEARELLDESQSVARIGSWSLDLETGAISWSREQFRLHGLEPGDDAPSIAELVALVEPEDRQMLEGTLARLSARPRSFQGEYRVRRPDGGSRILWSEAALLEADPEGGRPARVSGTTRDVTAERAAEHERQAIEQRHLRLLDSLPDTMVILFDTDLRLVLMQGGLIAAQGLDPASYLDRSLHEVMTDDSSRALPGLIRRALAGESITMDHDTGRGRQFQVEFAPYFADDGTVAGAFTVWRDITARLERERETRMLATMVQQSEDAIIATDPAGTIVEWSGGAERLYGHTRAEAIGHPIAMIVPPERAEEDRELLARALGGESLQLDAVRMRSDGRSVDVSISVSPLASPAGEISGALLVARDISPRIAEQAARRKVEDRLRVTVEHAPIGVALVDLQPGRAGRLLSVNRPFAALLPDPDPVAAGMSLPAVIHPDDTDKLRGKLALLASGASARIETDVRCLHADGRVVWLLLTGAAVPSDTGAPQFAVLHALDIGERKRFEGQLQHLADHDALTGLFNRRRLETELARTVSRVDRYHESSALLMIDLDGFKHVNDTMGHSYGDELITRVAACLRGCLRDTDVIGRLGGDEFAVILAAAGREVALGVAEKLRDAIAEQGVVVSEHRHASVTASIGVVPMTGPRIPDADTLLVEADVAMYAAKAAGRNRVALAERGAGARPALAARRSWLARLRTALEHDRFELYAQPIRPICAAQSERYELLLRLRDEHDELIAPAVFLHHAERFDLIQEIDRWVFARALTLLADCQRSGHDVCLSVNMSGRTLNDPRLITDLTALVSAQPVVHDRLVVEVTETAAIVNIERARHVAHALRELGARFALDDFGAGFASFYYLKHLHFDYLKIDGEFVKTLGANPTDALVIRTVVELARGLGAQTIAEFVGDDETLARLRALGVDYGQGFHLGRPGPVAEVLPLSSDAPRAPARR